MQAPHWCFDAVVLPLKITWTRYRYQTKMKYILLQQIRKIFSLVIQFYMIHHTPIFLHEQDTISILKSTLYDE